MALPDAQENYKRSIQSWGYSPLRCSCDSIPLNLHMEEEKVAHSLPVAVWSY